MKQLGWTTGTDILTVTRADTATGSGIGVGKFCAIGNGWTYPTTSGIFILLPKTTPTPTPTCPYPLYAFLPYTYQNSINQFFHHIYLQKC